jgi:hypothetical protein
MSFYFWLHQTGIDEGQARAAGFIALVAGHLALAPAILVRSGRGAPVRHSQILWVVTACALLLLVLMLIVPQLREIMRFSVPDFGLLILGPVVGIVAGGWTGLREVFGGFPFSRRRSAAA